MDWLKPKIWALLQISEYRYLKVSYESNITWQTNTDHLCCNPCFQKKPRYDCVIINTTKGIMFAKLIFVFVTKIEATEYPWAFIQPYDSPVGLLTSKEKDLEAISCMCPTSWLC
jgi:hypothetical protein